MRTWTWLAFVRPAGCPKARRRWKRGTVDATSAAEAHEEARKQLTCYWVETVSVEEKTDGQ